MSEDNLSDFKEENALLRKIVNVLLEQNESIKAENHRLRQQIEVKQPVYSVSGEGETSNELIHSPSGEAMTPKQLLDSLSQEATALNEIIHSTSDSSAALKQSIHSPSEEDVTPNQLQNSDGQAGRGMNRENEPLPLKLALSNENIYHLANQLLNAGFGGGKSDTTVAAAKILLHFYNEMPGDYKFLLRLSGYSQGGLGKLMMNLRRKGYLIKCGFQQHAVTGNACELMRKAGCN